MKGFQHRDLYINEIYNLSHRCLVKYSWKFARIDI